MFSDNDSLGVNNKISYEIFNDTLDMLKPECKAYEADHQGLRASAINCSMLPHITANHLKQPNSYIFCLFRALIFSQWYSEKKPILCRIDCLRSNC